MGRRYISTQNRLAFYGKKAAAAAFLRIGLPVNFEILAGMISAISLIPLSRVDPWFVSNVQRG
jgi:hypothetical protein